MEMLRRFRTFCHKVEQYKLVHFSQLDNGNPFHPFWYIFMQYIILISIIIDEKGKLSIRSLNKRNNIA
jgi:hypothetical protein